MTPISTYDTILLDVHLATLVPGAERYGQIRWGALGIKEGRIAWVGPASALPEKPERMALTVIRGKGRWLTPGLIDCHTHLVFGGQRVDEFERRQKGATYQEIAREGGGILSTVRRTREAPEELLLRDARGRLGRLVGEGVTTVEIKSGYGLSTEAEIKMLRVARALGRAPVVDIQTTFLGAHALPAEYQGKRDAYLQLIREEMIPIIAREGLADAVDAFCEPIAFSTQECEGVFAVAAAHGMPVRLHADQLSDGGGAALAARFGARSADHLEYVSEAGVKAMSVAGTTAVLLPGAFYFLREATAPPVHLFRSHGVSMALGTDCNPGSSPVLSLLLMINMGCVLFRLTPEEALAGVTRNAARALGLLDDRGTLEVGKRADLALWDVDDPAELAYWIGANPLKLVFKDGVARSPAAAQGALESEGPQA